MVLGILRPLIVVPADLVDRLRADEVTMVLMNELAHVRRCDNLWLLLQRLIRAILFFHPAVWLCGRMLRRESEQACDDLVVCATAARKPTRGASPWSPKVRPTRTLHQGESPW